MTYTSHFARSLTVLLIVAMILSTMPLPVWGSMASGHAPDARPIVNSSFEDLSAAAVLQLDPNDVGNSTLPVNNTGALHFSPAIDGDGDPATNPSEPLPVPVSRVGAADAGDFVRYATIDLAAEVRPDRATQNPAGVNVQFHIWNDSRKVDIVRSARSDAWGAAFVQIMFDDLHLDGTFYYEISAPGYTSAPVRTFRFDQNTYTYQVQFGAARLTSQVEADGRLVLNIESDAVIDDTPAAVQLVGVRLVVTSTTPTEPQREMLPLLVARRLDDHHARAELYLDAGDYSIMATVLSGKIEAYSKPILIHIDRVTPPPIASVESVSDPDEAGQTLLAQYRTPDGDVALLRQPLAALSAIPPEPPPASRTFNLTTRLGPFRWRTDTYTLKTETVSDDGLKIATLEGFDYDPIARSYDLSIQSLHEKPIDDRLTVQVLGPHGVVIYTETAPVSLKPDEPLKYRVTVPTDLGEPSGLRVILDDPLDMAWLVEKQQQLFIAAYHAYDKSLLRFNALGAELSLKIIGINIVTWGARCIVEMGCEDIETGLLFHPDDWKVIVTDGIRNYIRDNWGVGTIDQAVADLALKGLPLGAFTATIFVEARRFFTASPPACTNPAALQQAKELFKNLADSAHESSVAINFLAKKLTERLKRTGDLIDLPFPQLWFLAIRPALMLAFKIDAGQSGDFTLHAEFQVRLEASFSLILKPIPIKDLVKKLSQLRILMEGIWEGMEFITMGSRIIKMSLSAIELADTACNPSPPDGHPDDRQDNVQNIYPNTPLGVSGQIQNIQQQLATAQQLSLHRAETYWTLQLRQEELNAFQLDTTRRLSETAEITAVYSDTYLYMQGLISGTIQPPAGQTITTALQTALISFTTGIANTSIDVQRQNLLDNLEFAEANYNALRGQELELQRELRLLEAKGGIGVVDSGLVTWALGALGSLGIRAIPIQLVPGATSSSLSSSRYVSPYEAPPVLVVPSGGLYRYAGSQQVQHWLEAYTASGGVLIVLSQAAGDDWNMLPGGQVRGLGYLEDILCKIDSVQAVNTSPWILGLSKRTPDIQIDGSFTAWPTEATIVLMRTTGNRLPALIQYPYGNGQVIATSAYPDFYVNGMQSEDDVLFARSLFGQAYLVSTGETIAAAGTPNQPFSMAVAVTNTTGLTATQITVWGDYYNGRIGESWRWAAHQAYELRASQRLPLDPTLPSGASRVVTLTFTAPPRGGLFRSGLFVGTDNSWSASGGYGGPFYLVQSPDPWLRTFQVTQDQPDYIFGTQAVLTATIRNLAAITRTFTLMADVSLNAPPISIVVPPDAVATQVYTTSVNGYRVVRFDMVEDNLPVSTLVTILRLRDPELGLTLGADYVSAGYTTTLPITVTAAQVFPNTPVTISVSLNDALFFSTTLLLTAADGYYMAQTVATLPAAAPYSDYVVSAITGDDTQASISQTLPVRPLIEIVGTTLTSPVTPNSSNPGSALVWLSGNGYTGTAHLQTLYLRNNVVLTSGSVTNVELDGDYQQVALDLPLPSAIALAGDTLVISATSTVWASGIGYATRFTETLSWSSPDTTLLNSVLKAGDPLTARLRSSKDVTLSPNRVYTLTLRGVTTAFTATVVFTQAETTADGLSLTTIIPDLLRGGTYAAEIKTDQFTDWTEAELFEVPPQRFAYAYTTTQPIAGGALTWSIGNQGGINSSVSGTLLLYAPQGAIVAQTPVSAEVPFGSVAAIPLSIPASLPTGSYILSWQGYDHLNQFLQASNLIDINAQNGGIETSLQSRTDRPAYATTDAITSVSTITASSILTEAWLHLQVIKPLTASLPNATVTALGPAQSPPLPFIDDPHSSSIEIGNGPQRESRTRPNSDQLRASLLARRDAALAARRQHTKKVFPENDNFTPLGPTSSTTASSPAIACVPITSAIHISPTAGTLITVTTIDTNITWTAANSPYILTQTLTVSPSVTLTLEPGVIVKLGNGVDLIIEGILVTPPGPERAILTSLHDDTAGGDSDGLTITPQAKDWGWLQLVGQSAQSPLKALDVRYGTAIEADGALTLTDSLLSHIAYGVEIYEGSGSTLIGNAFDDVPGINFYSNHSLTTTQTSVLSNTFTNNVDHSWGGLVYYTDAADAVVQGNRWLDGTEGTGIHFYYDVRGVTLTGNLIQDIVPHYRDCCSGINFWDPAVQVNIEDNTFRNVPKATTAFLDMCCQGIQFWYDTDAVTIRRNHFENAWGIYNGIDFWDDNTHLIIDDNEFLDSSAFGSVLAYDSSGQPQEDAFGNVLQIWGNLQYFTITNNLFQGVAGPDNGPLEFWGDMNDGVIDHNQLEGVQDAMNGIHFWSTAQRVAVTHNQLTNFKPFIQKPRAVFDQGLIFWDAVQTLTVTDNLIDGAFNGGLIFYYDVGTSLIARNRIQHGYGKQQGIVFSHFVTQTAIVNNVVADMGQYTSTVDSRTFNGYSGLVLDDWMSDVLIAGNTLARLSGPGSGLLLWGRPTRVSTNVTVTENLIFDNPQGGLHFAGPFANTTAAYNVSARNRFGVWLLGTDRGVTLTNNTLVDALAGAVYLYSGQLQSPPGSGGDTFLQPGGSTDYGPASPHLANNLLVGSSGYDVYGLGSQAISPTLRYNDAWGAATPGVTLVFSGTTLVTTTTSITDVNATNLIIDPRLVHPAVGNYRLAPASPVIDAGDPAQFDPGTTSRIDLGALSRSGQIVLFDQVSPLASISNTLIETMPLGVLGADPRARGQLYLHAQLFGPSPATVSVTLRPALAQSEYPFLIDNAAVAVSLNTDRPMYRANLPGYPPDDDLSTVTFSGEVRNVSAATTSITLTLQRNDGVTVAVQSFANVAVDASVPYTVTDPTPPLGAVSYTATTNLGGPITTSIQVKPAEVQAVTTLNPGVVVEGEATLVQAALSNDSVVPAVVSSDLGSGEEITVLNAGQDINLTRIFTSTDPGVFHLPITMTGDLSRTDSIALVVQPAIITPNLALVGPLVDNVTVARSDSAALFLELTTPRLSRFNLRADYTLSGPINSTGSELRTFVNGQTSVTLPLNTLPVGLYTASFTLTRPASGLIVTTTALTFNLITPTFNLALNASAGTLLDSAGNIPIAITATNLITSGGVGWTGALNLTGVLTGSQSLALCPRDSSTYQALFSLVNRSGPQLIHAQLLGTDGVPYAGDTLLINASPRLAPVATLTNFTASNGSPGGVITLTATISNSGPAGEAQIEFVAFDRTYAPIVTLPAFGTATVDFAVIAPSNLLSGTYPLLARFKGVQLQTETTLIGAQLALSQTLDASGYQPFSVATWTIYLHGLSGSPAPYDVVLRYGDAEYVRTVSLGAGSVVTVPWTFNVGPASERATVLVSAHSAQPDLARYTLIIDSAWIPVIEDPRAWLQSDRSQYLAGDVVSLTLHLLQPINDASVFAPLELPASSSGLLLWSSYQVMSNTDVISPLVGSYHMTYQLPPNVRSGRYFFHFMFDGEERTLPIDVKGLSLRVTQLDVQVLNSTLTSPPTALRKAALTAVQDRTASIRVVSNLKVDQPVSSAILHAYGLTPAGDYLALGPTALITQSLVAGNNLIVLSGQLNTSAVGAHQIVLKVFEASSGVELGGEAAFIDVGRAMISTLTTDRGNYTPGAVATGTLTLFNRDVATTTVTTSAGTLLLAQTITTTGYVPLTFTLPTVSPVDEVLIGVVTDSLGFTSTLLTAYKVAATFDITPPQVSIIWPVPAFITGTVVLTVSTPASRVIAVTGSVSDDVAVASVVLNGITATLHGITWTAPVTLEDGINLFDVLAVDTADNTNYTALSIIAQPTAQMSLTTTQSTVRVGDVITFTTVVTTADRLTGTLIFPFDGQSLVPFTVTATAGTATLNEPDQPPVQWSGVITPDVPLTLEWTARAAQPITVTITALAYALGTFPIRSNTVARLILPSLRQLFLPIVLKLP
ncbi:hypothetical protein TFLX_06705 [Thermoflexales bacterium]|nr:hypothetical protein TFLX_06705 [Thermoflexales bacterium]